MADPSNTLNDRLPVPAESASCQPVRDAQVAPRPWWATVIVFAALAVVHTWPLASAPGTWSRNDNADSQLNQWILAWVAQMLPTHPLRLFQANIFYPEPRTLAFSESLIVQGTMAVPFHWLGASPVLTMNLVILLGMVLSGWAMCHVVARWTGNWYAGLVAGSLVAFNTHVLMRLGHVQAMHVEFLPLALLALDAVIARASLAQAVRLGLCVALQGLASGYLLVMALVAVGASTLARAREWGRSRPLVKLGALALAAMVCVAVVLPFLLPYALARQAQGLTRGIDEVAMYEASVAHYLSTGARLHYAAWSHRFYDGREALFPGVLAIVLAGCAVVGARALRDPRARMFAWLAVTGVTLSFGPAIPGYAWLHAHVPLLQGVRAVSRFGYLGLFGVAGLAGYGAAWISSRQAASRSRVVIGLVAVLVVNLESLRAPLDFVRFSGIPKVYDMIAAEAPAVVVEFPFPTRRYVAHNGQYVLASTRHWQPLLNGYSGYVPASYDEHARAFAGFPAASAIAALRAAGVTHVVVHAGPGGTLVQEADRCRDLRAIAGSRDLRLYRLLPSP